MTGSCVCKIDLVQTNFAQARGSVEHKMYYTRCAGAGSSTLLQLKLQCSIVKTDENKIGELFLCKTYDSL